jgi:hypothetical protein
MASRDLYNNVKFAQSLEPQTITAAANGTGVDTAAFESVVFVIDVGTMTGSAAEDVTVQLQESDALASGYTAIAAANLQGGLPPAFNAANDKAIYERGYLGSSRYVRAIVSAVTDSPSLLMSAHVVLGTPRHAPQ